MTAVCVDAMLISKLRYFEGYYLVILSFKRLLQKAETMLVTNVMDQVILIWYQKQCGYLSITSLSFFSYIHVNYYFLLTYFRENS